MGLGRTLFVLQIGKFEIDYCRDYGINRRNGWSVTWDGRVLSQFASNPLLAIIRAAK